MLSADMEGVAGGGTITTGCGIWFWGFAHLRSIDTRRIHGRGVDESLLVINVAASNVIQTAVSVWHRVVQDDEPNQT